MKRFYPKLSDVNHSFFVSANDVLPVEIDGVLTAPLLFDTPVVLAGENPQPYALADHVGIDTIYLRIVKHGVLPFKVTDTNLVFGVLGPSGYRLVVINSVFTLRSETIPKAEIVVKVLGSINFEKSVSELEASVTSFTGLRQAPQLVGYDLELFTK